MSIKLFIFLGKRLRRRLQNLLIISAVGFGTFYAYRQYSRNQWFNERINANKHTGQKPRIVVLGTGKEQI